MAAERLWQVAPTLAGREPKLAELELPEIVEQILYFEIECIRFIQSAMN